MAKRCAKCGSEIPEGWTSCPACFEPVRRGGFLARLLRGFSRGPAGPSRSPDQGSHFGISLKINTRIKIHDSKTGETREYGSLEEVPPEYREKLHQAQQMALGGTGGKTIMVTDASGQVHTYHSVDEMPAEIRALYDKARQGQL